VCSITGNRINKTKSTNQSSLGKSLSRKVKELERNKPSLKPNFTFLCWFYPNKPQAKQVTFLLLQINPSLCFHRGSVLKQQPVLLPQKERRHLKEVCCLCGWRRVSDTAAWPSQGGTRMESCCAVSLVVTLGSLC